MILPKPDNTDHYFLALGRFIDKFAQAEKELLWVMRILCGVTDDLARAVFSGTRTDAATKYIIRILTIKPLNPTIDQAIKRDAQYIFTQLGHINAARNSIVHYGTEFNESENYITTNRTAALTADRIRETPISTKIIEDMIFDLEKITWHLRRIAFQYISEIPDFLPPAWEGSATFLRAPWRYKPPPQSSQGGKRLAKSPKRQRLPRSSPG
jgi:hypothetical protein